MTNQTILLATGSSMRALVLRWQITLRIRIMGLWIIWIQVPGWRLVLTWQIDYPFVTMHVRTMSIKEMNTLKTTHLLLRLTPPNSSESDNLPQPSKLNSPPLKINGLVALHISILKNYVEQPKTSYKFFIIFIPTVKFQITAKNWAILIPAKAGIMVEGILWLPGSAMLKAV